MSNDQGEGMGEISEELMMHAERLYDEGGYKTVPTIIADAILAERERCADIASRAKWTAKSGANPKNTEVLSKIAEDMGSRIARAIRGEA